MIIDSHGHFTTAPQAHWDWRKAQLADPDSPPRYPDIPDDELRAAIEGNQLKLIRERGSDVTIFSPRASWMGHHEGDIENSIAWSRESNDLCGRVAELFPDTFVAGAQLPQAPGAPIDAAVAELERVVANGFVGVNLNPDPSGGHWTAPRITDRYWYPLYEKLSELEVPAMIHVSAADNDVFHATGAHYMNADTTAFMQLLEGDLFADFPDLTLVIPHGGGAVPYHWGRYRGLSDMLNKPGHAEKLMDNVLFDTCVYHQAGIDLLLRVMPVDSILFGSEMIGAVRGIDPQTGEHFDDTKRYIDASALSNADKEKVFSGNALRVYPRAKARLGL